MQTNDTQPEGTSPNDSRQTTSECAIPPSLAAGRDRNSEPEPGASVAVTDAAARSGVGGGLFAIGEKVQFMSVAVRGSSMSFSTCTGTIKAFSKPHGLKALVKKRNGREEWKRVSELRKLNGKSPVNDVFEAITGGGGAEPVTKTVETGRKAAAVSDTQKSGPWNLEPPAANEPSSATCDDGRSLRADAEPQVRSSAWVGEPDKSRAPHEEQPGAERSGRGAGGERTTL